MIGEKYAVAGNGRKEWVASCPIVFNVYERLKKRFVFNGQVKVG
jgi:hypothetical protein